ncbi:hypothetical protein A9Q87_03020 [Flavobacteriales bacterium 34_180_T64]|nr:hypothetical protein A9Q87_03020 [Flavobacteriales bacterium 34_180_T64]
MKTLLTKSVLGIMLITLSISATAFNSTSKNEIASITKEVKELLTDPSFEIDENQYARITIRFNENNEIVVLAVDSENDELDYFIKERLNYKKLTHTIINKRQNYIVPLKMDLKH